MFVRFDDGSSAQWVVEAQWPIITSDTPPQGVRVNTLWFKSATRQTFILYQDASSTQWIEISGPSGQALISDTPPANAPQGAFWWSSASGALFVRYGSIWAQAIMPAAESPTIAMLLARIEALEARLT
jgi:hypothetical protein